MIDARINRHGYMIGQRSDHAWAAREARYHVELAREYRQHAAYVAGFAAYQAASDRAMARFHLREAERWRRSYVARVTPAEDERELCAVCGEDITGKAGCPVSHTERELRDRGVNVDDLPDGAR